MNIQQISNPESYISQHVGQCAWGSACRLVFTFCFTTGYLPEPESCQLLALVDIANTPAGPKIYALLAEATPAAVESLAAVTETQNINAIAAGLQTPVINLTGPLPLVPISISKPWGQEIWYTGMESRGVSGIGTHGQSVPLPWVLALMPQRLVAGRGSVTLLKILDPLPDEVFGDLYFEMHESKQEVYVVTHVDPVAWPSGEGGIRFGFRRELRAEFSSDTEFRDAYIAAVGAYESVRRQIDQALDECRLAEGLALSQPVRPDRVAGWLAQIDKNLLDAEREKRAKMELFSRVLPLRVGDVVQVPCYTPHSLLHGVRTVEFQTPVYERKILSFAQKVLTQSHWDTREASESMRLDEPEPCQLVPLASESGLIVERIVNFDEFEVLRLCAQEAQQYNWPYGGDYLLLMGVAGSSAADTVPLLAEQALLVPGACLATLVLTMEPGAVLLAARPNPLT